MKEPNEDRKPLDEVLDVSLNTLSLSHSMKGALFTRDRRIVPRTQLHPTVFAYQGLEGELQVQPESTFE